MHMLTPVCLFQCVCDSLWFLLSALALSVRERTVEPGGLIPLAVPQSEGQKTGPQLQCASDASLGQQEAISPTPNQFLHNPGSPIFTVQAIQYAGGYRLSLFYKMGEQYFK